MDFIPRRFKYSVCVFIQDPITETILCVSRRDDKTKWSLPGGKVESRESIEDAAYRETYEEAGIDIIDPVPVYLSAIGAGNYMCVTYLVTAYKGIPTKIDPREGDVEWKTWDDLMNGPFAEYYVGLRKELDILNKMQNK